MQNKLLSYLGLAARGRNVVSGEFMTEKAVKSGTAFLVLVAEDASERTKKDVKDMCTFYDVPVYVTSTKEELGHAIGKEVRATVAITDEGLTKAILKHLVSIQNHATQ